MNPPHQPKTDGPQETLAALAAAASAGDQAAFERIHRRLAGGLLRILLQRTGGRADIAEELAQKTWVVVWEALRDRKYDPARSALTTYIYAISHKVWLQYIRSVGRGQALPADAESWASLGDAEPVSVAGMAELLQAVRASMDGTEPDALTPDERALARAVAAGHSDRSLAKLLGLAPSTTNVRKKAVFEKIRRFLAVRGHRGFQPERGTSSEE